MKPVDCHCHLDFEQFDEDRAKVVERCRENLEFVVSAGSTLENNKSALELQEKYDIIKSNLGLHPVYTDNFSELEEVKQQIRAEDPVAVGEIGLDHHHVKDQDLRNKQEQVFRELLSLAEELQKPVVIHSRDAEHKAVEILENYDLPEIFLHCFNGSPALAEEAAQKGMTIGVTTQVLYSNRVQKIVETLSLNDIVLETDSPFLYRGERNEPVNVEESAEKISKLKSVEKEKVVEKTTSTAKRIFGQ